DALLLLEQPVLRPLQYGLDGAGPRPRARSLRPRRSGAQRPDSRLQTQVALPRVLSREWGVPPGAGFSPGESASLVSWWGENRTPRRAGHPHSRTTRGRGVVGPRNIWSMAERATFRVKTGLAEMLKGGVIMDVVTPEQARIAEAAGACALMALERVPADIRRDGGVARMSDPVMIKGIQEAVTIPIMAKARIGHFAEAQVLQALEVDYIDESEVLTPADERHHIDKLAFEV